MEPKKVAILIALLVGLVFAGKYTCSMWKMYNPPAQAGYGAGYGYSEDYGDGTGAKGGKGGKGAKGAKGAETP